MILTLHHLQDSQAVPAGTYSLWLSYVPGGLGTVIASGEWHGDFGACPLPEAQLERAS